jgi:ubiquinone/menaquinone biosynthesis C-methylase UbiE
VGGDAEFLRRATGATVYAVEPSDLARHAAQRCFPLLQQVDGEAEQTGLPDGLADAVVMCGVLSLIEDPEPVLIEAMRLLAPDGQLAIADLFASDNTDLHSDPNVFRTPESVIALCAAHGLQPIEVAIGEPTPDEHWSDVSARVEMWIEEHCRDRPGFDAWCADRQHLTQHIDNGDVLGGCLIFG